MTLHWPGRWPPPSGEGGPRPGGQPFPWWRGAVPDREETPGRGRSPGDAGRPPPRDPSPPGMPRLLGAPGSPRAWRFFEMGFRPWMKRNLSGVHLAEWEGPTRDQGAGTPASSPASTQLEVGSSGGGGAPGEYDPEPTPLFLVANHTSWFDGFLLREVHRRLRPAAPLRFLMLDRELRRSRSLRWIGGTGFDPERPLTLRRALGELDALRGEGVVVGWFPQGRIYPATKRPLGFHDGIELALRRMAPARVIPVGIHLEMGRTPRPAAWILHGPPLPVSTPSRALTALRLEEEVTSLLERIQGHLHAFGEEAPCTWPPPGAR